jgi:tetratricopeptide (TPR) repeat protein
VAYGSLLQERRRALHARTVEALEALAAPRLSDVLDRLAHHALRGEVWDKAVAYLQQAGEQALARSAHREAVTSFEQALVALQRLPESRDTLAQAIDLRLDLRNALLPLGELGRIRDCLQDAATLAETLDDQHHLGWVAASLSAHFVQVCEPDHALASGHRALTIAAALGDVELTVTVQYYLGHAYRSLGAYRQAIELLQNNVACLHDALYQVRFGLPGLASVLSRSLLALALADGGAFTEGRAPLQEGVQIAEAAEHPYSCIVAYWSTGRLLLRQGDVSQAVPMLERTFDLAQGAYLGLLVPLVAASLGAAYVLAGRTADALPLLERAVEQAVTIHLLIEHALRLVWLGEAYARAGRLDEAHAQAQRALEFSRAHQERSHEAYALQLLGEIATHRQPPQVAPAEASYQQALALADELGMRPLQAHCHLGLGTLYRHMGRLEEARAALSTAVTLYRAMDMTHWLPQAETALAQMCRQGK